MAAVELPPSLKPIAQYVAKAKQFQKIKPMVAHFCKKYAVEVGIQIRDKADKSTLAFLMPLMDELESEAKEDPSLREDHKIDFELFTLELFTKADNQYYDGKADIRTAGIYRVSSVLMEVCKHWGELSGDIAEKYKYAKVKAVEIQRAVSEGRVAMPPQATLPDAPTTAPEAVVGQPIVEEEEEEDDDDAPPPPPPPKPAAASAFAAGHSVMPPPTSAPPAAAAAPPPRPPAATASAFAPPPPPAAAPAAKYGASSPASSLGGASSVENLQARSRSQISTEDIVAAEKYAKYALSSIQFDDVKAAVENLKAALSRLT